MKKELLKPLVSLCLIGSLISVGFVKNPVSASDSIDITILGTSDVHGRFMPWEYATDTPNTKGSLTQISTLVNKIRTENPNTILVDAGDSIQDNYCEIFKDYADNPMVTAMNDMEYDAWVMGNHEFNFTQDVLNRTISKFNGTALSGNIYKEDGTRFLPAYKIIEKDGVKIGIIGMTTPMIVQFEKDNGNLDGLVINNAVEETKKAIKELKGNVDLLIGVMHMGEANENNIPDTGVIDLANVCPELDAIVAGHMHLNVSSKLINGVLVTEPYKYGNSLSKIDIKVQKDGTGYKVIDKRAETLSVNNVESNKALEEKLAPFNNILRDMVNQPIGKLVNENLVHEDEIKGISTVFTEPTGIMNLFHDVAKYYSKADVVAFCTDNEKAKLNVGDIKIKDIAANYTYTGGEVSVYEVTGKDLKMYMEWSADYFNTLKDGDVIISYNPNRRNSKYSTNDIFGGVNYKIDLTKETGNRITDLTFPNGDSITDDTKLTLGMNSYRLEGLQKEGGIFHGKNFNKIYDSKEVFGEDEGTIRNLTIKYIKEVKNGILEPNLNKNWEIIGTDKTSKSYNVVKDFINKGLIKLHTTADNKYTNASSINVKSLTNLSEQELSSRTTELESRLKNAATDTERHVINTQIELIKALNK
ncbi:5'-nucleotidase C-terminal domain-containing protein [Clostridium sp. ZBS12]|uniref:bifunctional metallophosphatase/5'-nucleotidase n=1 Tax=Clostridium sp. ZBS12 TaxID=2949972 RepID=UPI0020795E27|nr:5'-nucleotidase C-terminal domain-containing protein [Clostridium sp. ZBS12]